jgi:hypothetical protein
MSRARKHIGAAVLLTFLLASCGGGDSSSGRVRNAAIECFNTQEEKDAAVVAEQAEVDAEVVDAQVALDAANARPLCSEVESAPTETLVPPVEDDSALACAIAVTDNGTSVTVEFCDQVTRVRIGVDATGEWIDAEGNAGTAELGEGRTFQYVALAGDTVLSEGSWNLDSADNVAEFSVTAAEEEPKETLPGAIILGTENPLIGQVLIATAAADCEEIQNPAWWEYTLVRKHNGADMVDAVSYGAAGKLIPHFSGAYTVVAKNTCASTDQPIVASLPIEVLAGSAPTNDDFSAARALEGVKGSLSLNTGGTTIEGGEPDHGCYGPYGSAWFSFTAVSAGSLRLDSAGTTFDNMLAVYSGSSLVGLKQIGFGDDESGENAVAIVAVEAGQRVSIASDGCGYYGATGQQGVLSLSWLFTAEGAAVDIAEAQTEAPSVIADAIGSLGTIQIQEGTSSLTFDAGDLDQILTAAQLANAEVFLQSGTQEWTKLDPKADATKLNIGGSDSVIDVMVKPAVGDPVPLSIGLEHAQINIADLSPEDSGGSGLGKYVLFVLLIALIGAGAFVVVTRYGIGAKQIGAVVAVIAVAGTIFVISGSEEVKAESIATTMRPLSDGFSFPNFPSSVSVETFDVNDLVTMFGNGVCVGEKADPCIPTAEAAAWARMVNQARASGHCEGLVVQAAVRFASAVSPKTVDLPNEGEITHGIYRAFATQFLPEAQAETDEWAKKSLREITNALVESFKTGSAQYSMGLYTEKGGHAVLPYAIEFIDKDHANVQVYDSNWPGKNRYVEIDLAKKQWRFSFAGKDPAKDAKAWTGGEGWIDLTSLESRASATCPFCGSDNKVKNTMLVIKSTDAEWTVTTKNGSFSPKDGNQVDGIDARPLRGATSDEIALEYVVFVDSSDMTLDMPDQTSAFIVQDNAIVQVLSTEQNSAPVEISNSQISVNDPNVTLTVASDNLVASTAGGNNTIDLSAQELNVSITSASGEQYSVVVNSEQPQVNARAVTGGTTDTQFVVTAQTANNQTVVREVARGGAETVTNSVGSVGLNTVVSDLPPALQSAVVRVGLSSLDSRNLANPLYQADIPYTPPTGLIVSNPTGSRACDLPGFPSNWIIQPGASGCTAPVLTISASTSSQNAVGTACSENGVTGTWTRFGASGSVTCMPTVATAANVMNVSARLGTACSEYGIVGTWEYSGASVVCQSRTASSALNRAGTACTLPEFPVAWVFSPSGSTCVAPILAATYSRSPGMACSENGVTGTWTYLNGTATLTCSNATSMALAVSTAATSIANTAFQSCSTMGFPAAWTMTATGTCIAPVMTAATAASTAFGSCASRGFPSFWVMNASGSCSAPVVAVATGATATAVGGACSQGGVPGTWGYLNGSATIICVPFAGSAASTTNFSSCVSRGFPATWTQTASGSCIAPIFASAPVATAPVATAPATGAGSITTSIQFGAACSISGMAGSYQYAGGTATLVCTPYATSTAATLPSTAVSTRSCAEDGFPAAWTRTATGTCIAPIMFTAPVATAPATGAGAINTSIQFGAACSISGMAGTYQYAGGTATLVCTPFATSTAPTMPSTAISTRSCAEDGFPATWTRTATGSCVAPVVYTAPVATAPPATTGPVATAPPATTGPVATAPPATTGPVATAPPAAGAGG